MGTCPPPSDPLLSNAYYFIYFWWEWSAWYWWKGRAIHHRVRVEFSPNIRVTATITHVHANKHSSESNVAWVRCLHGACDVSSIWSIGNPSNTVVAGSSPLWHLFYSWNTLSTEARAHTNTHTELSACAAIERNTWWNPIATMCSCACETVVKLK